MLGAIQTQRSKIEVMLRHDSCLHFMLSENGFIIRVIGLDIAYALTDAEFESIASYYRGRHVDTLMGHFKKIDYIWENLARLERLQPYVDSLTDNYLAFRTKCLVELAVFGHVLTPNPGEISIDQDALSALLEVD